MTKAEYTKNWRINLGGVKWGGTKQAFSGKQIAMSYQLTKLAILQNWGYFLRS